MRTLLEMLGRLALMPLCLGVALDEARATDGRPAGAFAELEGVEQITAQTGAFSPAAGDTIVDAALFLRACFERFDGTDRPGRGQSARHADLRTTGGRMVARFLDWPGAQ